jgi:hypothetical protein
MMKRCFKCGMEKPLDAFYAHAQMADGHLNKCKDCTKVDVRRHRIENPERVREYDRERSQLPHRRAARSQYHQQFEERHPDKRAAHVAVGNALRCGKLKKQPCVFCGAVGEVEAHHRDYSKPLDVTWLCRPCHRRFHALERMATYREDAA